MNDTQTQVERLIELAIVQRTELRQLVEQLPQLREHLNAEIERTFEEVEPQIRTELEEFCAARATDEHAKTGAALAAKIEELSKQLEATTSAKYSVLMAERAHNVELERIATEQVAQAAKEIPSQVKAIVADELSRFPRAGEIDQLRKEFATPAGLNPRGKWQAGQTYERLDVVSYNGNSYIANGKTSEKPSADSSAWTINAARGTGGGGPSSLNELTQTPTNGSVLIGSGTSWVTSTLTAGTGISIANAAGSITINATDGNITLDDGTAAAPALNFTNDPDTGIYRIGANNIGVAANGAKVLDIATTGLGITGLATISSTTASTGVGTGALQVAGGIYAGAASVFGANVKLNGALLIANINSIDNGVTLFQLGQAAPYRSVYGLGLTNAFLSWGGNTVSFPALKRDGTTLKITLGDDSADANLSAGAATFSADATINTVRVGLGASSVSKNTVLSAAGGAAITSGDENVLIGYNAGAGITSGSQNVFVGALTSATGNSSYNTFVGAGTPASALTGNENTAMGRNASGSITSGARNTTLGSQAGYSNLTGTNNVMLGYFSGRYETGSNAFYVDNQDRTNTAGDKAKALLYGTFNATAASQTLAINGVVSILNTVNSVSPTSPNRTITMVVGGVTLYISAKTSND